MDHLGRLKQKIKSNQKSTGAWLFTSSTDMAEILGGKGFDAIVIDQEHGPGHYSAAVDQHPAVRAAGDSTVCMRVPWNDPVAVKKALDGVYAEVKG